MRRSLLLLALLVPLALQGAPAYATVVSSTASSAHGDVTPQAAAAVRGTLRTSSGAVPPQTQVDLQQQTPSGWSVVDSARTTTTGAWAFTQLVDGTYRLHAFREGDEQEVTSPEETVTSGDDRAVPLQSEPGATITGRVTATDGKAQKSNVVVFLRNGDGTFAPVPLQREGYSEVTDSRTGAYRVGGLAAGTYRLLATGYWRNHGSAGYRWLPGRYWRHAVHLRDATDIVVGDRATVDHIDPVLNLELHPHGVMSLRGTPRVGRVLRAVGPGWRAAHLVVRYRWFVGGRRITRAHGPTLRLTRAMSGRHIYAAAVGRAPGYATAHDITPDRVVRPNR